MEVKQPPNRYGTALKNTSKNKIHVTICQKNRQKKTTNPSPTMKKLFAKREKPLVIKRQSG
jgi:hypothetical protein